VGDAAETALLRADLDAAGAKDFEIYSGDDIMLLPHLAAGAVGIVSVCAHLVGDRIADIFRAWHADAHEARRLYLELVPLFAVVMGVTSSPIPVKAALGMLGIEVGGLRAPLYEAIEPERDAIRKAMHDAGLL
jgi:4-hydroxy-tetrahydrodipicolinate synthase